jgi:chromosome segregation ATPase
MSRRSYWFGLVLLFASVGCGSDTQEVLISKTISELDQAGNLITQIRDELDKAKKEAEPDKTRYANSPEVYKHLKKAEDLAGELKVRGDELSKVRQQIDILKEPVTPEQQAEYAKKVRGKLSGALDTLVNSKNELQKIIQQIESVGREARDALKPIQTKLREADGQFESLNRPR